MPHFVTTLIYLSQNYSYYVRGDRSPLNLIVAKRTTDVMEVTSLIHSAYLAAGSCTPQVYRLGTDMFGRLC